MAAKRTNIRNFTLRNGQVWTHFTGKQVNSREIKNIGIEIDNSRIL